MKLSSVAVQRKMLRLRQLAIDWSGWSGQLYFEHRVGEYREIWRKVAAELDGTFTTLAPDLWEIEIEGARARLLNHQLEFDDPVTLGLAGRKAVVHRLLAAAGVAVPEYATFSIDELATARAFVDAHADGCVIKPAGGYGGKGVTTHVQHRREVRRAALLASLHDSELLIEKQVPGESYRLLVLEGQVVHAVCRRGPRVDADGESSVRELLNRENERRRVETLPPLDIDRDCLFTLKYQRLALDSRPERGREILLKSVNDHARKYVEVRTVYTHTVTDLICDSIRKDAETAAQVVGSNFLGVDVITRDPSRSLRETGGVVNEVNTTPALHHHYDAAHERYPRAALLALRASLRRHSPRLAQV